MSYDELDLTVIHEEGATPARERDIEKAQEKAHKTARADKQKTHGRSVTITNPNYVGGNEREGAEESVPTIHLGTKARHSGGETLGQLETDYNAYTPSFRSTLRAMGRLKDLDAAGAKLDPAAVKKDKALSAKFHPTSDKAEKGEDERMDHFEAWSSQATVEKIEIASMGAGQRQLQAALHGFRGAEAMLKRRQSQASLENASADKAKIDQSIDTLVQIVDTCFTAVEWAQKIESYVLMTHGVDDLATLDARDEAKEAKALAKPTVSGQQSLGNAAAMMGDQIKRHHTQIESWAKSGGLTLRNILIVASGEAEEYEKLTQKISKLKNDIFALGYDAETEQIKQADEQLQGMKMEMGVRAEKVAEKQRSARGAAGVFGRGVGGDEGALAMYAAQAYQDLSMFGDDADRKARRTMDPFLGWLYGFLERSAYPAEGHGWSEDWHLMKDWGQSMVEQREFLKARVPEWKDKAKAWNQFFAEMTGGDLVRK